MYKYLLFDLDGTITKSEEGIFNCIKYALDWAGIPYPEYSVFRSFIGPSLYDSFVREFGMDDAKAKEMVAKYRERYNVVGLFEAEVYDGVADTLHALKEKGCILSVATSKPTEPTLRILEKFGVGKYFDVVVGSNPDGTGSDKKHIISQVLESLKKDHGLTDDKIKPGCDDRRQTLRHRRWQSLRPPDHRSPLRLRQQRRIRSSRRRQHSRKPRGNPESVDRKVAYSL